MDGPSYQWTVGPRSARDAARALIRHQWRSRAMAKLALAALAAFCSSMYVVGFDAMEHGIERLAWSVVIGVVGFGGGVLLALPFRHLPCQRRLSRQLHPGDQFSSSFGPESVEMVGPLGQGRWSFAGFRSIDTVDDWLVVDHGAAAAPVLWPAQLFPEDELDRIRSAMGRQDIRRSWPRS